jgi:hypothetical protein
MGDIHIVASFVLESTRLSRTYMHVQQRLQSFLTRLWSISFCNPWGSLALQLGVATPCRVNHWSESDGMLGSDMIILGNGHKRHDSAMHKRKVGEIL